MTTQQHDTTPHQRPSRLAVATLILANLAPLIGVAFLGWSLFAVMFLFWLENWVIGAFNVARMATAGPHPAGSPAPRLVSRLGTALTRLPLIAFFLLHYGLFCFVHGVFVFSLFGKDEAIGPGSPLDIARGTVDAVTRERGLLIATAALAVSHGVSFATNFIGRGEWNETSPRAQMVKPYARIVVLHLAILFGGFAVVLLGAPLGVLLLLVLLKIAFDLHAHLRQHGSSAGLRRLLRR